MYPQEEYARDLSSSHISTIVEQPKRLWKCKPHPARTHVIFFVKLRSCSKSGEGQVRFSSETWAIVKLQSRFWSIPGPFWSKSFLSIPIRNQRIWTRSCYIVISTVPPLNTTHPRLYIQGSYWQEKNILGRWVLNKSCSYNDGCPPVFQVPTWQRNWS